MAAGSDASNFGYGNIAPFSNVKGGFVNVDNSHSPGPFGSNQIPGTPPGPLQGLAGTKDNVVAAAGKAPGICLFKGGSKNLKRKIKNITKMYKMKGGSRKRRSLKKKIRSNYSKYSRYSKLHRRRKHSRKQKGGYGQYQNNLPMTPTYSVGGHLTAGNSALANPPPINRLSNCVNCVDNYNHFTNKGFPSRGH
jgi:hypothetical protein